VTQAVAEGIYEWDIGSNSLWVSSRLIEIFGLGGAQPYRGRLEFAPPSRGFSAVSRSVAARCFKGLTPRLDCE